MDTIGAKDTLRPEIGVVYYHTEGLRYRVDGFVLSAEGYEETGQLIEMVLYTQLDKGEKCGSGQQFVRTLPDFIKNFSG